MEIRSLEVFHDLFRSPKLGDISPVVTVNLARFIQHLGAKGIRLGDELFFLGNMDRGVWGVSVSRIIELLVEGGRVVRLLADMHAACFTKTIDGHGARGDLH